MNVTPQALAEIMNKQKDLEIQKITIQESGQNVTV